VRVALRIYASLHACIAVMFGAAAIALIAIATRMAWLALRSGLTPATAQVVIEAVGYLAAAVVALQIAQTIVEEEVIRDAHISAPTRVRRFLSRFLVVIVVALALEGLVAAFRALHTQLTELVPTGVLVIAVGVLLAGWGFFVRCNRYAEELEPEAMEEAKSEDSKLR
jgi:hypothetical protein